MTTEQIARVAHEVNKAYCESVGDQSIKNRRLLTGGKL